MSLHRKMPSILLLALIFGTLSACSNDESAKKEMESLPPVANKTETQTKPSWQTINTNSKVMSIAFKEHELWLGLSPSSRYPAGGVIRHDLRTVKDHELYNPTNTYGGLMSEGVYRIKPDAQGDLWLATYGGGLSKYDGEKWTNYTPAGYGAPEPDVWTSYEAGQGLGDMWVYDVAFTKDDTLWVATWKGASRFNRKDNTFRTYTMGDGLVDKWVYAIGVDHADTIWFGTEGGVTHFDGENWTSYNHEDGLGAEVSESIPGNPHHVESEHHATPSKGNIASNPNYVMSLVIDDDDNKWFGTWGSGLSRFDGKQWKTYTTEDGLAGNFVFSLAIDNNGILWAGTEKGVSRFDGKEWKSYTRRDGLMDDFVYSIGIDPDNNKWFGTRSGVSKFTEGNAG